MFDLLLGLLLNANDWIGPFDKHGRLSPLKMTLFIVVFLINACLFGFFAYILIGTAHMFIQQAEYSLMAILITGLLLVLTGYMGRNTFSYAQQLVAFLTRKVK